MIAVIPMAGGDQAFQEKGYPFCKSLIEVQGRPLIEHVWENLRTLTADKYIFVIRKEDAQKYHLDEVLHLLDPHAEAIATEGPTGGAACSVLLAIEHIVADDELVITNGDQLVRCDLGEVVRRFREQHLDGGTIIFDSVHPRWSFVRLDAGGLVNEAAEKRPISRNATAGFYYFRRGADFITAAASMLRKDAHCDGRFFVCPVFNEMVLRQARIGVHRVAREAYTSLATPRNLEEYEQSLAKEKLRSTT
jgi:dTDP-glucose pyrophosphorylase